MPSIIRFGEGKLAVVEEWAKGEERVNLLRSYGECPEVPMGHYVFNVPGTTFIAADVADVRREAAARGYTRRAGNPRIVEALLTHQSVEVLWWRHNLATGSSFIRQFNLGSPRETPLSEDDLVIIQDTGKSSGSEHGHWMVYHAVSQTQLDRAHPRCQGCYGTGVRSLRHFDSWGEYICSCVDGKSYTRAHLGTLQEVALDRYHMVVVRDRGIPWGEYEADLIGKYTSREVAEAEAAKWRRDPWFTPGRGNIVAIRVVERPLPDWA